MDTKNCSKNGMFFTDTGLSVESSVGTWRQPWTTRPSSVARNSMVRLAEARRAGSVERNAMPMA